MVCFSQLLWREVDLFHSIDKPHLLAKSDSLHEWPGAISPTARIKHPFLTSSKRTREASLETSLGQCGSGKGGKRGQRN